MTPRLALAALAAAAALAATAAASFAGSAPEGGSSASDPAANESSLESLQHYPAALEGHTRFVLHLPERENEEDLKVEIIAGQQQQWSCNRPWLRTDMKTQDVKGWGYDYHIVSWDGKFFAHMVGCLGPEKKETSYIHGTGTLVRYNSRLPVVVFLPKDLSMRYRIWTAGSEQSVKLSSAAEKAAATEMDVPEGKAGRQSVQSTQIKGTKVIRKSDKSGNKITFTQSD